MIQLELTTEEAEMLQEVLESYCSDLRMEIANTDSSIFREMLKKKESFLIAVLQRLRNE